MEGAGGLLLLAGASATGLLATLDQAVGTAQVQTESRLAHHRPETRQGLLCTLLFLGAAGLRRPWDLRAYSGSGLAVLSGRRRAYGYETVVRFRREVVAAGGAQTLTDALGQWTTRLWSAPRPAVAGAPPSFYIDGHRKAVYSDVLVPRGLVGRRGAVLGCRALILLHDAAGHPLFVTTQRGDTHLTVGVPAFLARYEAHNPALRGFIIDREGMAAEFLAELTQAGRHIVTLLRRDQYVDLSSFDEVGPFVPWRWDRRGRLIQEVAAARYRLNRPEQLAEPLALWVALVRDPRPPRPHPPTTAEDSDLLRPADPPRPRLLPVVSTAPCADPAALAAAYIQRWPAQENSIKDFLVPLGLDTNHGFAKRQIPNSESAKRYAALDQHLDTLRRRAQGATQRADQAVRSYARQSALATKQGGVWYGALNDRRAQERARDPKAPASAESVALGRAADAAVARPWARAQRAWLRYRHETATARRYAHEVRLFVDYRAELVAHERPMYELDNAVDQVMSVCTVALTNLAMWVRDAYFPASYQRATWTRLAPFFHLPGRIVSTPSTVEVTLRPFPSRALSRDLALLCERVAAVRPRLPDGRVLALSIVDAPHPLLYEQPVAVA